MTARVGSTSCAFVRGTAPSQSERVTTWQVPGLDGYGAHKLGQGDAPFAFECVYYAVDDADADLWVDHMLEEKGTLAEIENDRGVVYERMLITAMSAPQVRVALGVKGGVTYTRRASMTVEGVRTS